MKKEVIQQALRNNEHGIYSLIISEHYPKLIELKTKFFIKWIASEYEVEEAVINEKSIISAKWRYEHPKNEKKNQSGFTKDVFDSKNENGSRLKFN